jgi:hypothetical protein
VTRTATTNGINDIEGVPNGFSASLYPNPYEGTTVIHIEVSEYTEFSISVYDILGREVRQINVAGSTSFDVPLSDFNESMGMYLIAVSDMHTRLILKMIKL